MNGTSNIKIVHAILHQS